jgi:hypothetical protein
MNIAESISPDRPTGAAAQRSTTAFGVRFGAIGAVLAILIGALPMATDAGAMPLPGASSSLVQSETVLVRDGCGRGMRFSNRRQECVEDFDDGPPPRVMDDRRDYRRDDRREYRRDEAPVVRECGRGMRWSNSRGQCVWIDGARRDDDGAAAAAAAGAAAVGIIGAAAAANSADKGRAPADGQRRAVRP